MVNKDSVINILQRLIQARSENPPGDESKVAKIVVDGMKHIGLDVKIHEFTKNRPNVLGIFRGEERVPGLCLIAHLDTVPAGKGWSVDPFEGVVKNGRIYGRGASDCKGNVAVILEAIRELIEESFVPNRDIEILFVADEETGSKYGMRALIKKGIPKSKNVVIVDSGNFGIVVAQKGLLHLRIKVYGKEAHGAAPWLGVNAIEQSVKIIRELKRRFNGKGFSSVTVNIGKIKGGEKVNMVADYCEFDIDIRYPPGKDGRKILRDVKSIIKSVTKNFKIEILDSQDPYLLKKKDLMGKLKKSMQKVGVEPRIDRIKGAVGLSLFKGKNVIATGFGSPYQAHKANEYISIKNLVNGVEVIKEFIKIL